MWTSLSTLLRDHSHSTSAGQYAALDRAALTGPPPDVPAAVWQRLTFGRVLEVVAAAGGGKTQCAVSCAVAFAHSDPDNVVIWCSSSASHVAARMYTRAVAMVKDTTARAVAAASSDASGLHFVRWCPRAARVQNDGMRVPLDECVRVSDGAWTVAADAPSDSLRICTCIEASLRASALGSVHYAEVTSVLGQVHVVECTDAHALLAALADMADAARSGVPARGMDGMTVSAAAEDAAPAGAPPATLPASLCVHTCVHEALLRKMAPGRVGRFMIVVDSVQPLLGAVLGSARAYAGHALAAEVVLCLRRLSRHLPACVLLTNGLAHASQDAVRARPALGQVWTFAADCTVRVDGVVLKSRCVSSGE